MKRGELGFDYHKLSQFVIVKNEMKRCYSVQSSHFSSIMYVCIVSL